MEKKTLHQFVEQSEDVLSRHERFKHIPLTEDETRISLSVKFDGVQGERPHKSRIVWDTSDARYDLSKLYDQIEKLYYYKIVVEKFEKEKDDKGREYVVRRISGYYRSIDFHTESDLGVLTALLTSIEDGVAKLVEVPDNDIEQNAPIVGNSVG